MIDSDATTLSDDGDHDGLQISPKRVRPFQLQSPMKEHKNKPLNMEFNPHKLTLRAALPDRLAQSQYSYSYEQNTGSLLNIRLGAMQHSLDVLVSDTEKNPHGALKNEHLDVSLIKKLASTSRNRLVSNISPSKKPHFSRRISIPLEGHEIKSDDEVTAFLTVPYMDLAEENKPFIRPPSMMRRASSMILKKNQLYNPQDGVSVEQKSEMGGIPTPLPHQNSKGAIGQALFTTEPEAPFKIKTLNDIAKSVMGLPEQELKSTNVMNLVTPRLHDFLKSRIFQSSTQTKLSGEILMINGSNNESSEKLVSVCVEAPANSSVLIWVITPVPATKLETGSATTIQVPEGYTRVESTSPYSLNQDIYLAGPGLWLPHNIASTVVLNSKTQHVVSYNAPSLKAMLGVEESELEGKPISDIIPQFSELWTAVSQYCVSPGVVIPEHAFRRHVGIPLNSSAFFSPFPSRDPDHSIIASYGEFSCFVDLQLRVVSSEYLVLWISYSRPIPINTDELMPDNLSVPSSTPPRTPNRSHSRTSSRTPSQASSLRTSKSETSNETPVSSPRFRSRASSVISMSSDSGLSYDLPPSALESVKATQSLEAKYMDIKVGEKRRDMKVETFKIIKALGSGAYGEVNLVRTPKSHDVVALKSIYKDRILIDTWSRDRSLGTIPNEIRILNEIRSSQHPNIVWMIDFFEDRKCYYVEMIPCGSPNAMDLFDFIEQKSDSQSPMELFNIWQQVVSAVAHIHSLNIVHRDIKDENVIVDDQGVAKLIDFGSSAYVKQGPFDLFFGTIDYAAPEIVLGELYGGMPQDIWALGILLYIIMFQEVPFKDSQEIVSTEVPLNETSIADSIITTILRRDPADRPTALELMDMGPSEGSPSPTDEK